MNGEQIQRSTETPPASERGLMNKELFGVFGDADAFRNHRSESEFHSIVSGARVTVGVRDPALGTADRTNVAETEDGLCVIWGEAYTPDDVDDDSATWLLDRYAAAGRDAFAELNGSYIAVVDYDGDVIVATDPIRSWECFYTDRLGSRAFGTDGTALKRLLPEVDHRRRSILEFLHLGTVLGNRTLFEEIDRVPFDGYLTPTDVGEFDRFVYEPQEADHATELADRLRRAIDRRSGYPGRKGLLLSAGQDSRTILAGQPDISRCYTVGTVDSQEVEIARRLAQQYGASHTALEAGVRYLRADEQKIKYTQGIRESLHIHHAGYDDQLDVDTIYHGLLYDTLFKGYFLERDSHEVFSVEIPSKRLVDDPDPVASLLDTLGFMPEGSRRLGDCVGDLFDGVDVDDPKTFVRESLTEEIAACRRRADSVHNLMDLLVLRNQPVMHFRTHLADNYLESFVAADRELLEWHLRTPPQHRNYETVKVALDRLDNGLLRHRPPNRPHDHELLNHVERFARRKLPLLEPFQPAWPDRRELYERHHLDDHFFPSNSDVRELPVRQKLRVNDLRWWLS